MPAETRDFNLFVLLRRADDLSGIWRAEIPDIEVIMQGRSPSMALEAAWEASRMVIAHDLNNGIDPLRFATTASDERALMAHIMRGSPVTMIPVMLLDALQDKIGAMVVQLPLRVAREVAESPRETDESLGVWPGHGNDGQHIGA